MQHFVLYTFTLNETNSYWKCFTFDIIDTFLSGMLLVGRLTNCAALHAQPPKLFMLYNVVIHIRVHTERERDTHTYLSFSSFLFFFRLVILMVATAVDVRLSRGLTKAKRRHEIGVVFSVFFIPFLQHVMRTTTN